MQWPSWASQSSSERLPRWLRSPESGRSIIIRIGLFLFGILVLLYVTLSLRVSTENWQGTFRPDPALDINGYNGAVASDVGLCSQMGVDVLKRDGSAADAAVVVCLCIGSMNAQSSGIGGGGFITVRLPNDTAFVIDARETAPREAHKDMFNENSLLSRVGGLASGVPGELAGLEKLWQLAGRRPWKELVDSVADINDRGFPRSEHLSKAAEEYRDLMLKSQPEVWYNLYNVSDWNWLYEDAQGPIVRRPALAKTLRAVANEGSQAFYNPHGWIAKSLASMTQRTGGVITADDFGDYAAIVKPALNTTFRDRTVFTAPAPASGNALMLGLNVMDNILPDKVVDGDQDAVLMHRTIETMKWMAAARSELGDPAYIQNSKMTEMLDMVWAQRVIGNISDARTLNSWRDYHPSYEMNQPNGTSHFSVLDKDGMAVSMTTTVNLLFGNFVCDPETGVIMNSQMDDFAVSNTRNSFDLVPSIYNFIAPGKRPLSSTVPSIVVGDDGVELVVGAAGGSRILTSVFQALIRRYAFDLTALETVSFPRLHHQLIPENAELEIGWSKAVYKGLKSRGHKVEYTTSKSAMSLIQKDEAGTLHAIGDFYRKRGLGAAY